MPALPAADLPPIEVVEEPTPAYARHLEVVDKTRQLLADRDMEGLEALAAELRANRAALDGGTWILASFYREAVDLPDEEPAARQMMDFYERWAAEHPGSITARLCLAQAHVSHAWNARGRGWANTVTDEGWRLMRERLAKAWEVLERAKELEEKCPAWYSTAQMVALGQGWDREEYMDLVREAIRREPTYGSYYTQACYWLFPRWYGEPGDFEKWIAARADTHPPDQRDRQYARFVWMAERNGMDSEMVFAPGRLDWTRVKRGFEVWLEEMPGNLMVRFEYMRLALLANDRETLREQFDITGGKYFPAMWRSEENFEAARAFAYGEGENPLLAREQTRPRTPASRLTPEVIEMTKLGVRLAVGFIGGGMAGAFLLGLALQRRQVWAGGIAGLAALVLGTIFGTAAALVPAGGLYLYFRSKRFDHPPPLGPASGWMAFLWVIVIMGLSLGMQIVAVALGAIPLLMEHGFASADEVTKIVMTNGLALRAPLNAFFICFLLLLLVCRPQNPSGWRERLGLHAFRIGPSLLWMLVICVLTIGLGVLLQPYMDERSRQAMNEIREMRATPVLFLLVIGFLGPIFEELLFRGYAYAAWIRKIGFWGTAAASSLIFAAAHVQYGWVALLWVLFFGVVLAGLRWKTGSVYPCIAVHIVNNLANCVMVLLAPG